MKEAQDTTYLNDAQQAELDSGEAVTSFTENDNGELVITRSLDTDIAEELNEHMREENAGKSLDELRADNDGKMVVGANIPMIAIEQWCRVNGYTFFDFINASQDSEINQQFYSWLNGDNNATWRCTDLTL